MMTIIIIIVLVVCGVILFTGFSEGRSLTETLRTTMLAYNEILVRTRTEVTRREESTMLREQQDREYRESAEAGDYHRFFSFFCNTCILHFSITTISHWS